MDSKPVVLVIVVVTLLWSGRVRADGPNDPGAVAARGRELLANGNFDDALAAFRAAAQADPHNPTFRNEFSMLRRVCQIRERLPSEQNPDRWEALARSVRTYYHANGLFAESLPLDRRVYERHPNANTIAMLAETMLALGQHRETVELLSALDEARQSARTNVLLGVALAEVGRISDAKAVAAQVTLPSDAGRQFQYDMARLQALVMDGGQAARYLSRAFELTPPSRLDTLKAQAQSEPAFKHLIDTPAFARAMKTESKVPESMCSMGPECGKCPKRGGCQSSGE